MSQYRLPLLLNPLLDAVFNCPAPDSSPLRKLFGKLRSRKFVVLVPPTGVLLSNVEVHSGISLSELCYSMDFVSSHIIFVDELPPQTSTATSSSGHSDQYFTTANGKTLILRGQYIISGNGFDLKQKYKVIDADLLPNFSEYLGTEDMFGILYVDGQLNVSSKVDNSLSLNKLTTVKTEREQKPTVMKPLQQDTLQKRITTFENDLIAHPEVSKKCNLYLEDYRKLPAEQGPAPEIIQKIEKQIYNHVVAQSAFKYVISSPSLITDYIESKLYNNIWERILYTLKDTKLPLEGINCISLYDVGIELLSTSFQDFLLSSVVQLEKRVAKAVEVLQSIAHAKTHSGKGKVLVKTLQLLSNISSESNNNGAWASMDADTLLNVFILTICRANVRDLKAHLYYLQNFFVKDNATKFGVMAYAISTAEAVSYYFNDIVQRGKLKEFKYRCDTAAQLVSAIETGKDNKTLAYSFRDSLKYRTPLGDSVLSLCIIHHKNELLWELLTKFEALFPLEDILDDEDVSGSTLLMKGLQNGNIEASRWIADIFISSCTEEELRVYLNKTDSNGRTVAHYLVYDADLLQAITPYINWAIQDTSGYTPVFTILRNYDQLQYGSMVTFISKNVGNISVQRDPKGNSLLHIVKSSAAAILENKQVDPNVYNNKGMVPLMVCTKYNRISNIEDLLQDKRTVVNKLQKPTCLSSLSYAKNPVVVHMLGCATAKTQVFGLVAVHTPKYDSKGWSVHITVRSNEAALFDTSLCRITTVQRLIKALSKKFPSTFLPVENVFGKLSVLPKGRVLGIDKLETQNTLDFVSILLNVAVATNKIRASLLTDDKKMSHWAKKYMRKGPDTIDRQKEREKSIQPEDISMVTKFLKFSETELTNLRKIVGETRKLLVFLKLKHIDLESAAILFDENKNRLSAKNFSKQWVMLEKTSFVASHDPIIPFWSHFAFLDECIYKLHLQIQSLVKVKAPLWWRYYGEFLELQNNYAKKFPEVISGNIDTGDASVFDKYLAGGRLKQEKQLSLEISKTKRVLSSLGLEIQKKHEELAEELSSFMDFKGRFLEAVVLRIFSIPHIRLLKEQLLSETHSYDLARKKFL